jgi:hypothetical protein
MPKSEEGKWYMLDARESHTLWLRLPPPLVLLQVMQPVGCLFQFNELSTPLLNVRQYLLTAEYASSNPQVAISSLVFFSVFGLVRVAPLPFVIRSWILRDFEAVRRKIGTGGAIFLTLFFALQACLQCGWFFIMCRKFVEMFRNLMGKQPKRKED